MRGSTLLRLWGTSISLESDSVAIPRCYLQCDSPVIVRPTVSYIRSPVSVAFGDTCRGDSCDGAQPQRLEGVGVALVSRGQPVRLVASALHILKEKQIWSKATDTVAVQRSAFLFPSSQPSSISSRTNWERLRRSNRYLPTAPLSQEVVRRQGRGMPGKLCATRPGK
jgi:hypothetical protein